ncbi:heavy-metal-associated domain-containing protein [uncultured Croceitalea sp.]|uniref:heavy-metal-associated domain-containing protein n=1 Tax=uncultured Croceitalea sp. TaxID=1798908 RepID=UPI00374FC4AF
MKTILEIQNLKCGGCENTIRKKLSKLHFINNLNINLEESAISFAPISREETTLVALKLSEMGYPVRDETNSLAKKVKSYMSCAIGRIQK